MATFYFNGAVDGDWAELGNWWLDDTFTTQATGLPTAADSVVLKSGPATNSGDPIVIANITVNRDDVFITDFNATVTGVATFNDGWYSGTLTGNAVFNGAAQLYGTINGDVTFNDDAVNDSGTINGNTTFTFAATTPSPYLGNGTYNGTVSFPNIPNAFGCTDISATNYSSEAIFNDGSCAYVLYFTGAADGDWSNLANWYYESSGVVGVSALPTAADSVIALASITSNSGSEPTVVNFTIGGGEQMSIAITVTGMATFNDSSINFYGTVSGNAIFNDSSQSFGLVTGNATFNGFSSNILYYIDANDYTDGVVDGDATFNDYASNRGTVTGNGTFNDYSHNFNDGTYIGVVNGNATFNDNATNGFFDLVEAFVTAYGTVEGNAIFNNNSKNYGTVSTNSTFNNSSVNSYGKVYGDATFNNSSLNNYGTVYRDATFNDYSHNYYDGTVLGTATFNNTSVNKGYANNAIFNDSSFNDGLSGGNVNNAIFNHNSYNLYNSWDTYWAVYGNAIFNDSSFNNGNVLGTATFRGSSYNDPEYGSAGGIVYEQRTPYPIPRGINGSSILGVI